MAEYTARNGDFNAVFGAYLRDYKTIFVDSDAKVALS
jgi:hypothetical protein